MRLEQCGKSGIGWLDHDIPNNRFRDTLIRNTLGIARHLAELTPVKECLIQRIFARRFFTTKFRSRQQCAVPGSSSCSSSYSRRRLL
jgi:hypothetical protein